MTVVRCTPYPRASPSIDAPSPYRRIRSRISASDSRCRTGFESRPFCSDDSAAVPESGHSGVLTTPPGCLAGPLDPWSASFSRISGGFESRPQKSTPVVGITTFSLVRPGFERGPEGFPRPALLPPEHRPRAGRKPGGRRQVSRYSTNCGWSTSRVSTVVKPASVAYRRTVSGRMTVPVPVPSSCMLTARQCSVLNA